MFKITKISLNKLVEFSQSDLYKSLENKPISPARIASYLNNPNAHKEDIVLYMAFVANKLVGYRTVFADVFYDTDKKEKIAWLSGNWVHPKHRRKNIATLLYKEIAKDWNNRLVYSNYAEASKLLYDKTNNFTTLKTLKGRRYYRKFSFYKVLPSKHFVFKKTAYLLKFIDWIFNLFVFGNKPNTKLLEAYSIQKIKDWDSDEVLEFLSPFKQKELFKRTLKDYRWIIEYPWIKTDLETKKTTKNYYFSAYALHYENDFYCIKLKEKIIAIVNISTRDGHLKIPYFYGLRDSSLPALEFILNICKTQKIYFFTIYDSLLLAELKKHQFLFQKDFSQKFYITKELLNNHPVIRNTEIQVGDGDSVFT